MISESFAIEPAPLYAVGTSSLQSPVGITDVTTNYDQVSETNPIPGVLFPHLQERIAISLHRANLKKELTTLFESEDNINKFLEVKNDDQ